MSLYLGSIKNKENINKFKIKYKSKNWLSDFFFL